MLLCCAVPVAEAEIEAAIERLYHTIAVQNSSPDGQLLLLADLETADAYRVAVPMKAPLACDSYECVMLESGWYLGTMHNGDYYSIGMAYDRVLRYRHVFQNRIAIELQSLHMRFTVSQSDCPQGVFFDELYFAGSYVFHLGNP